jgi:hypothetical protein
MFWKKKSEAYHHLDWKMTKYVWTNSEHQGSKEYLPTKSDLDNLSEGELTKFIEKEIQDSINLYKSTLKTVEDHLVSPSLQDPETIAFNKKQIKEKKELLRYYGEFLEAVEAGGLREKVSDEKGV